MLSHSLSLRSSSATGCSTSYSSRSPCLVRISGHHFNTDGHFGPLIIRSTKVWGQATRNMPPLQAISELAQRGVSEELVSSQEERSQVTTVPIEDLRETVRCAVEAEGHSEDDAEIITDVSSFAVLWRAHAECE